MAEHDYMKHLMLVLGRRSDIRLWRQNVGQIPVRNAAGKIIRMFTAGPPNGAADLSGIVRPEGWRLEIEVKGPRGKRSPAQKRWAKFIRSSGGVYLLAEFNKSKSMEENLKVATAALDKAIKERRG